MGGYQDSKFYKKKKKVKNLAKWGWVGVIKIRFLRAYLEDGAKKIRKEGSFFSF